MLNGDLLLGFASWEDRFQLGMARDLDRFKKVRRVLVFYFGSYAERTEEGRDDLGRKCAMLGIRCDSCILDVEDPATNWQEVVKVIEEAVLECGRIIVDISTMPREVIWYIFWYVSQSNTEGRYIYHTPRDYGTWASRDPRTPRLVYKLSGLSLPSNDTVVLVTLGYDIQRAIRLFSWYEPTEVIVGVQQGSRFKRNRELMENHMKLLEVEYGCSVFQLDAFGDDRGEEAIRRALSQVPQDRNILMSSLGPKLSSVSFFKIQQSNPMCGLVYTPATEYNEDYSVGIRESYVGRIATRK